MSVASDEDGIIWLVNSRFSPGVGVPLRAAGILLILAGGWWLATESDGSLLPTMLMALFIFSAGAVLYTVGTTLASRKGGVALDSRNKRLLILGATAGDQVVIPLDQLGEVKLFPRVEQWGRKAVEVRIWSLEVLTRHGWSVTLLESQDEGRAEEAAAILKEHLRGAAVERTGESFEPDWNRAGRIPGVTSTSDGVGIGVKLGPRWPAAAQLASGGFLAFFIGAMMMANIAAAPVFGFIFGPALAFLGLSLLGVWIGKCLLVEELSLSPKGWVRRLKLLGRGFLVSGPMPREDSRLRLVSRGGQGFCLQLVADNSIMVLFSGVSIKTRLASGSLGELAGCLAGAGGGKIG